MVINRVWWTANKHTFKIKPAFRLVKEYLGDGKNCVDPFCGQSDFCEFRNDLDPLNKIADSHLEAVDFLNTVKSGLSGAVFDPPYSLTQVSRSYKDIGLKFKGKENPTGGFPMVRDLLAMKIKQGGYCVSFGWNSCGLGIKRGFEIVEILLISHGGYRNDTICTVERKND